MAFVRIIPHLSMASFAAAGIWVWQRLGRAGRRLLDGVGSACPGCGGAACAGLLCASCMQAMLDQSRVRRCPRCALRLGVSQAGRHGGLCVDCALHPPAFARAVAAFDYETPFDTLIRRYKGARRHMMANALAQALMQALQATQGSHAAKPDVAPPIDVLIPVPSSRASLRRRGFNPAGELARALSRRLALRLVRNTLRRRQENRTRQASLTRPDREAAALDAYVCVHRLDGLHIALVDDVMTTGSTADAAARALLDAGAASVTVWVATRTPRPL